MGEICKEAFVGSQRGCASRSKKDGAALVETFVKGFQAPVLASCSEHGSTSSCGWNATETKVLLQQSFKCNVPEADFSVGGGSDSEARSSPKCSAVDVGGA